MKKKKCPPTKIHCLGAKYLQRAVYSVTVTAGFNAACCPVPDRRPTAEVSMRLNNGPHNQTPIAGIANLKIFPTEGASSISSKLVVVVVVELDGDTNLSPSEGSKVDSDSKSSNFVEKRAPIIVG